MNDHRACVPRFHGSIAIAALILASIAGHSAIAQVQAPTVSGAPPALSVPGSLVQDIREIRGPKPVTSAWLIPLVALSIILAGAGAWGAWVWYRRRSRLFLETPLDIALARLDYARGLIQPELGRDFSTEVSSIVRDYMELRFRVRAVHRTTHEFLHDLLRSDDPLLIANRPLLAEFMESCDLAKFGGWRLSMQDMESMLQSARRFVVESAAEPGRRETIAGPASMPTDPTPTAAVNAPLATPRGSYDSLPST